MTKPSRGLASVWRIAIASRFRTRARSARASRRTATGQPLSPGWRVVGATALALTVGLLGTVSALGQGSLPVKVLVFHGSTTHESVDAGVDAITELGTGNDFQVDATTDAADITEANLADYRAVIALHSSGDAFSSSQQSALQGFIQAGGGFLAIGEAAELEPGVAFFDNLIGARPAVGSPTEVTERIVEVGDRVHPATRELPLEWGPRPDAWYQWAQNPTGQVHTVARVRHGLTADDGWRTGTTSVPISWCRDFQGGRSFYTGMGRTTGSYSEANFRDHLLGAIEWAAGMLRGGCKATIASNYETVRLTNGANGLANAGEAHGVTVAPNGWVITTSRADCGSNEERGARVGLASLARTLDFASPNVGVGCAPIHIWDPAEYDGTLNSGNTRAGTLTVYGDRGGGPEINGKIETGGLGITVAPNFTETGHIYVQYFPVFNQNPVHPGLADGAQRRITKMGKGRVSRFTIDLDTKELDLSSEVVIFEYDSQIYSCCHRGGGMGWDSEGNLYVTTGDSNSSGSTGGYSGNYQPNTCPTGDPSEASNAHCGDNPVSYNDARRTAGSTNDYNGKMLRINPIDSIDESDPPPPGAGSTYTLPNADSPNGPNLFSGTEGNGNQTKPEIYAMGLRNPSRLSIDPETDVPYSAWVGPDAGSPSVTLGPSTYEVASQIPEAGNWGWPYCMGNKQAYRDRVADGSPRTTNEPGFVTGGPAASPTQGWYDCDDLVNNSTRNTGLEVLPHSTGTGMDAGSVRPANIWYSRGNQGQNNGCPTFPREHGADGAPNYGATPTALCPYYNNLGGWTIMNGPVYRHEPDPGNNAMRWPEYWDGRWFVHDFSGGNAKSFGFLLNPETAADGGQPSYVDKMSQYINWSGGVYMDSKFGPDGALYLQTYDGNYFFHGINDGLHRVSYTGGPDTPNPDPQWQSLGSGEIEFSIGRSGGVAYEWDFGDGSEPSTEPNPVHTYGESGAYEVTLTVTYADDEEASQTIEIFVSDDTTPPVTTHSLDPTEPGEGGTYDGPVDVTLSATDPDEGGGGGEPETHDVDATGTTWTPDALEIAFGDEVRWNFPSATAGFPHDVWLIAPGEAPDSAGTEVTSGVVNPGGPSVAHTFEESGTWTFVCKVHSFVNQGAWQGMVGTIDVGEDTGGGGAASGVERTEYRVNTDGATGEWQTSLNDGEEDPFETTFTVADEGDHVVEYRSRDRAGNVEETKSVDFEIAGDEPPPPGGECLPQSDEFVGDSLDEKWDVLRPAGVGPQVADGSLSLEFRQGDFIANDALAENTVLQDAPNGEWTVTTRLDTSGINANGEQAGLVIWKSENPNTFSKIVAIQSGAGNDQFEHIVTQNGSVNPPIPQSITPAPGGQLPAQVLLRARYTGTEVIGEFSDDNGQSWTRIGQEGHAAPLTAPLRIGLAAFRGSNGGGFADFDWFRVHAGSDAGGPVACAEECVTRTDEFDGTELNTQRWSFRHPTMPGTGEGAPRVEGGNLVFPLGANSVDQARQGPIAFLGQPVPDGDFTVEAKINAPGLNADTGGMESDYAQVGLGLYQTDDDWIAAYHTRNADDGGTEETYFEMKYETEGSRSIGPRVGQAPAEENLPTFWLRVTRSGDTITAAYSLTDPDEGGEWIDLLESPNLGDIFSPADGPVYIGAVGANGTIEATYEYIRFDPDEEECPPVDGCPQSDEFNGTQLDSKWEIVNPNPDGRSIGGGNLTLTTAQGDVFGGNFTAQNILLQQAPEGAWTATTKLDHTAINSNGQAAGLVIYGQENPNHFAKTATQYKNTDLSGNPMNGIWVERVLTTDGAVNPNYGGSGEFGPNPNFPNTGKLEPPTDDLWIRARFDGTEVHTEYSLDGSAFAPSAPPFPASVLGSAGVTKIGLFVKHDGGGPATDVDFDWFRVEAASCPADGDATPPTTTHSLDPAAPDGAGGWYVSPVEVTLTATDNEGGSGVDVTEYRFEGEQNWTTYEGPFTVSDDGRHTIQYRSHDNDGNAETIRSVSFRIDSAAPTTTARLNGADPVPNYNGPVDVELLADDGSGSGVTATEIRVDGGDWQPYVTEETILNSEADLERWAQAGPGGLEWIA
ncbi:MAG TPA: ThuA domain-containing protein, partial [Solirubrobacterales bacterium]|nr:ThuA domain-containing protein [Solirubrobacterales bacterium]